MTSLATLTRHDGLLTERLDVEADADGVVLFRECEIADEPGAMVVFRIAPDEIADVRAALGRVPEAVDPRQGALW